METELRLRIVLTRPPAGVDFGLQEGKGRDYRTVQTQRSTGADLVFTCTVWVKGSRGAGPPTIVGPFAQGPPAARFIYIDVGKLAGQSDSAWERRIKVPLGGITWELVGRGVLEARLPGTGKDGGPSCATVHPVGGWNPAR